MKEMAKKTYSKKGDAIVQLNYKAIDAGKDAIEEVAVDASWSDLTVTTTRSASLEERKLYPM